ncbi:MAG: hypothetical protein KIS61_28035, partial [Candidatus Eremiobacteraeota bacterium]|nr:hypothetical protein [Candidatus Eremiobacteraeota bacterium]
MIKHPAQHFFLENLIDYAGTFPPAALSLAASLANFRADQQGPAPSMLGRLICAGSALPELAELVVSTDSFLISALLAKPEDLSLVADFHARVGKAVRVDTLETAWSETASEWSRAWNYRLFFEVTSPAFAQAAAFCAPQAARLGLKLRTGSVQAEGIPAADQVADFLEKAHAAGVPYKFTAGLHHARAGEYALSYDSGSPRARCFGFTSLFTLACLHWCGQLSKDELVEQLGSDGTPTADSQGLHWERWSCNIEQIREYRQRGGRSFGSCSFREPLQELQEMGW